MPDSRDFVKSNDKGARICLAFSLSASNGQPSAPDDLLVLM